MLEFLCVSALGYFERQWCQSCQALNRTHAVNYLQKPHFLLLGPDSSHPRQSAQGQKTRTIVKLIALPQKLWQVARFLAIEFQPKHVISPPHSGRGSGNLLWVRVRGWQQRATVAWASCLVLRELVNSWKEGRGFCSATHFQILLLALGWRISHGTEFTFIHLNTQMFIDFLLSVRLDARLWKEISTFNSVFSIGGLIGKISLSVFTEL